eukprot:TRINITY_DN510_c1_g2_i1.p1 TRINITY_DN510_c1_g2~~TRINITY_DN510_c1_g2_i1.p1  ORF type:complete len:685 (+),score=82.99 TRINITY_DN510_c1_g2_i1:158-2056(+)
MIELCRHNGLDQIPGLTVTMQHNIKSIVETYLPCVPSCCVVEGLVETLSLEQYVFFKVTTKDRHARTRSAVGQSLQVEVSPEEFQIYDVQDNRKGDIEVTVLPLKVGQFRINICLDGVPISKSPFTVTVGPVPPPIHTLQKSDLTDLMEIGKGNHGIIYKGKCNGLDVAVKEITSINANNQIDDFLTEVNILQRIHHPNIVLFLGVCIGIERNVSKWHIVMEYAEKQSLQKVLNNRDISVEQKFQFALDIARGMAWLHGRIPPIIHFDLKTANILVFKDNTCKIADFGLSLVSEMKEMKTGRGTMLYMPPETLRRKWYIKTNKKDQLDKVAPVPQENLTKVDVYSFSLILWEIFVQSEVFIEYTDIEAFCFAVCDRGVRPSLELKQIPPLAKPILTACWSKEAKDRPNFKDIVYLLDACRIRTILEYPCEVDFWSRHWPNKQKVPLKDFCKAFWRKTSKPTFLEFNKLLSTTTQGEVTITGYRKFLEWFGPINEGCRLEEFIRTLYSPWFYPMMESNSASGIIIFELSRFKKAPFLVRLNMGLSHPVLPCPFSITFYANNNVQHSRIYRLNENDIRSPLQFRLNQIAYQNDTLVGLISLLCSELPNQFGCPVSLPPPIYDEFTKPKEKCQNI